MASAAVLDWAIIGGGIHGVHLAARLLGEARVPAEKLRIVDPAPSLLETWRRCSGNAGMRHLRSPGVHHLDLEPWSLVQFAEAKAAGDSKGMFAPPYGRPSRSLFADHCARVIQRFGLDHRHQRDAAVHLDLTCDHVGVGLQSGTKLLARHVLLAIGSASELRWPSWALALREEGAQVRHVFDPGFVLAPQTQPSRVAVIGAGLTGAQVALRLADTHEVHLISRHALRKHQFDSDPGWIGPKHMRRFLMTEDPDARRAQITAARHTGSMPPDVHRALRRAMEGGRVQFHRGTVQSAKGGDALTLGIDSQRIQVDSVLLATGFGSGRPGGTLVDELVDTHALPCASCGFPIVDAHLRWHPRVFVTGPLAELEIGPVSRNIVGARRAAERIVPVACA
ncbi:MAG: FAD/NAD(P)-binding protein [Myxococcota bacterium]